MKETNDGRMVERQILRGGTQRRLDPKFAYSEMSTRSGVADHCSRNGRIYTTYTRNAESFHKSVQESGQIVSLPSKSKIVLVSLSYRLGAVSKKHNHFRHLADRLLCSFEMRRQIPSHDATKQKSFRSTVHSQLSNTGDRNSTFVFFL